VVDDAKAGGGRQPDGSGEPERVKERQHPHHHIVGHQIEDLPDGIDIRKDVAVREHDAFRHAGAAAGEDNCRESIAGNAIHIEPVDRPCGQQACRDEHPYLRAAAELLHHVLEKHHAIDRLETGSRQKPPGTDDRVGQQPQAEADQEFGSLQSALLQGVGVTVWRHMQTHDRSAACEVS
jgi:hypothetical protein